MAILVTGGAGFIGSHVCEALLEKGFEVVCLDNFDPFYDPMIKRKNISSCLAYDKFHLIEADILDTLSLEKIFSGFEIDKVIHLAARSSVSDSVLCPERCLAVNVDGTKNLLRFSSKVKRFIFISSSSVYADSIVPFSEENTPSEQLSPYASSKRLAELACHDHHSIYGTSIICLRLFNVYGPRSRPDLAITKFSAMIEKGQPIEVYGDGTSRRDYTYITDVVKAILSAIDTDVSFEAINVGTSHSTTLFDIISVIESSLGKRASLIMKPPRPGDALMTQADISKANSILGFVPSVSIDSGIMSYIDWFKSEPL